MPFRHQRRRDHHVQPPDDAALLAGDLYPFQDTPLWEQEMVKLV